MTNTGSLQVTTPSDREIVMTRAFDAPRRLIWEAYTTPDLLKRWLLGPPGWSMSVCDMDLRVGGAYRWAWRSDSDGTEFGLGGVYREITTPERLAATEQFDQSWYPGEALVTLALTEADGRTTLAQTIRYESKEARDVALKSDMEKGVAASYDRLADLLTSQEA